MLDLEYTINCHRRKNSHLDWIIIFIHDSEGSCQVQDNLCYSNMLCFVTYLICFVAQKKALCEYFLTCDCGRAQAHINLNMALTSIARTRPIDASDSFQFICEQSPFLPPARQSRRPRRTSTRPTLHQSYDILI